MDKYSESW